MPTCKNCIDFEKCGYCEDNEICNWFRDKDRFVELPCKVGDTVYFISDGHYYCTNDACSECEYPDDLAEKYFGNSCEFVRFGHEVEKYKMKSLYDIFHWYSYFGKGAFTTREEAENKIKELYDLNNTSSTDEYINGTDEYINGLKGLIQKS